MRKQLVQPVARVSIGFSDGRLSQMKLFTIWSSVRPKGWGAWGVNMQENWFLPKFCLFFCCIRGQMMKRECPHWTPHTGTSESKLRLPLTSANTVVQWINCKSFKKLAGKEMAGLDYKKVHLNQRPRTPCCETSRHFLVEHVLKLSKALKVEGRAAQKCCCSTSVKHRGVKLPLRGACQG